MLLEANNEGTEDLNIRYLWSRLSDAIDQGSNIFNDIKLTTVKSQMLYLINTDGTADDYETDVVDLKAVAKVENDN